MNQYNSSIPKFIVSVFLIVTGFFSSTIKAQELKLMIKINEAVFYDRITSNKIIGTGHLFNREEKILISSSLEKIKNTPGAYIIRGQNNSAHKLRIRIGGEDWQPDNSGIGMVSHSDFTNEFNIYYFGNGNIPVDTYLIAYMRQKLNYNKGCANWRTYNS